MTKTIDETQMNMKYLDFLKDSSIISKLSAIPDLLKRDEENVNIEYIKVRNIRISSEVELESDVDR